MVVASRLDVTPDVLWPDLATLAAVNREMGPWLALTGDLDLSPAALGRVQRLRLRGPLGVPLGPYPFRLEAVHAGGGFVERTRSSPLFTWHHERVLSADGRHRTRLEDRLAWEWPAERLDPAVAAGVRRFFAHRHAVLHARFGGERV